MMKLRLKDSSVKVERISIYHMIILLFAWYNWQGLGNKGLWRGSFMVITRWNEWAKGSNPNTLHYKDCAVDFRTNDLSAEATHELKHSLNMTKKFINPFIEKMFDHQLQYEIESNHLHIELEHLMFKQGLD